MILICGNTPGVHKRNRHPETDTQRRGPHDNGNRDQSDTHGQAKELQGCCQPPEAEGIRKTLPGALRGGTALRHLDCRCLASRMGEYMLPLL